MVADIRLNDSNNTVIVDGSMGLGTNSPARILHTEAGEIHTGGSSGGYSFADRGVTGLVNNPTDGQRWVWYASAKAARLWSSVDAFIVRKRASGPAFEAEINGRLAVSDALSVGGNVAVGTSNPQRPVHVESGEIHSGGTGGGFSFSDRNSPAFVTNPTTGQRWLWSAQSGAASLWSGTDALTVRRIPVVHGDFIVEVNGNLKVKEIQADTIQGGVLNGTQAHLLRGSPGENNAETMRFGAKLVTLNDPAAPTSIPIPEQIVGRNEGDGIAAPPPPPPPPVPPPHIPVPPRIALFHDFAANQRDRLVLNHQNRYPDGVRVEGNLHVTGAVSQASSATLKEDVRELSGSAAMAALDGLNAVTFRYKEDSRAEQHVGFIAEDVPELVARPGRQTLSPMDIVAVLTRAVQEQQTMIAALSAEVSQLKRGGVAP